METALIVLAFGCAMHQPHIIGAILPGAETDDIPYSQDGKTEGTWIPTEEMIRSAEPVNFQLEYDVESATCVNFVVNGEA